MYSQGITFSMFVSIQMVKGGHEYLNYQPCAIPVRQQCEMKHSLRLMATKIRYKD